MGEEIRALPPLEKTPKRGKGGYSPSYAEVATSQPPNKRKEGRSDAIKVSAKDGQSYAGILKEMKAKVDPRNAGLEVLSIRRTRKEEVVLVFKKGGDASAFRKELDRAIGERADISALVSTSSLEIGTSTRPLKKKRLCLPCAWHWADRLLMGPAGSTPPLVG